MQIVVDVFPAHFQLTPAGHLETIDVLNAHPPTKDPDIYYLATTRVVLTEDTVTVAQDSPQGAMIVFQEKYSKDALLGPKGPKKTYKLTTESGKMLAFQKDTNCGCGSRLRSWNPYKTLTSQRGVK
jgi:hypothetical protein